MPSPGSGCLLVICSQQKARGLVYVLSHGPKEKSAKSREQLTAEVYGKIKMPTS